MPTDGKRRIAMRPKRSQTVAMLTLCLLALLPGRPAGAEGGTRVTLTLRYASTVAVPVPRVPGATRVTVPLYPGAVRTGRRFPFSYENPTPGSPYLRVAGAKFEASASAAAVEAWYRRQMEGFGWSLQGSGSSGNLRTGVSQDMLTFARPHSATTASPESVTTWFYALTPGSTLVGIWATKVVQPPRPLSSYLPAGIRRVTGDLDTFGTTARTQRLDITYLPAIARLTAAINRLRRLDVGFVGCPAVTRVAVLAFHPASGARIPVRMELGCRVVVGRIAFEDYPSVQAAFLYALAHPSR